jgi:hypothetical protein
VRTPKPRPARLSTWAPGLLVAGLLSAVLPALAVPAVADPSAHTLECASPNGTLAADDPAAQVVTKPTPAGAAIASAADRAAIAAANDLSRAKVARIEADPAAWVDSCGAIFYADQPRPGSPAASHDAEREHEHGHEQGEPGDLPLTETASSAQVPGDVLALSSRPGSTRTVYLDFTGEVTTGTHWNRSYGEPIVSPAYSLTEPADTNFDAEERAQIYAAWRSVAEDYAAFDLNITTADPGPEALTRTSSVDPTYGTRVVITPRNAVADNGARGGVAYLGTFATVGSEVYQPAWAFSDFSGRYGLSIAQVISHEVGHTLGLSHDGTAFPSQPASAYNTGAGEWAPIMGASYGRRVSQWSAGEYPGANNRQDDIAIIASLAPVLPDDHANTRAGATALTMHAPAGGILTSRTDVDAFTITASGATHLSLSGPAEVSNADLSLTVLDAAGQQVAHVNPTRPSATAEASLHASWSATLPSTPSVYTVLVDGVGTGEPATAGQYSDYGSLGAYTLLWSATDTTPPLTVAPAAPDLTYPIEAVVFESTIVTAAGGHPPYIYTAGALPSGLMMDDRNGTLLGRPDVAGSIAALVSVTDSHGATASTTVTLTVTGKPPVVPPTTDDTDDGPRKSAGPKFRTRWLPSASRGRSYKGIVKVAAAGGLKVRASRPPAGMRARVQTNRRGTFARVVVRGVPRSKGTYRFKVIATAAGERTQRTFTIRVR